MKPLSECQLYTFVDTAYLRGRSSESVARSLCDGGSDLIQLRAKNSPRQVHSSVIWVRRTFSMPATAIPLNSGLLIRISGLV